MRLMSARGYLGFRSLLLCALAIALVAGCQRNNNPVVVIKTELGEITVEVFVDKAPISSRSFLDFVDNELYEGAAFYRTVMPENDNGNPPISVIQGGVLDVAMTLPTVEHESTEATGILHTDGVISLARGEPGTGSGAAFFICVGDQPALDFGAMRNPDGLGFAAFGKVTRGMDVVHRIHQREALGAAETEYTQGQVLTEFVQIDSVQRSSK